MHPTQEKILNLLQQGPLKDLALREIGEKIGEKGSPQTIKHHMDQLAKKGLIVIDKKKNTISKRGMGKIEGTNLVSLPIYGTADCGVATHFADDRPEGYLKISEKLLGSTLVLKLSDLFVVRAAGRSMNRAEIDNQSIDPGDYVIVDRSVKVPDNNDYVLSVIDGVANIKKVFIDRRAHQVVLMSESNEDIAPIFIHEDDLGSYIISGKVVRVMKEPDEMAEWMNASAEDVLKELGPMSDKEAEYYNNPANFKKYAA